MNKRLNNKGFTMAELLIVVAIIVVLAGVSFIAVANNQRSMTRLEYDTIAKEIFISAQNHLTMAESQGFMQTDKDGNLIAVQYGAASSFADTTNNVDDSRDKVYYVTYSPDDETPAKDKDMLELMLPFGAVDETIRTGGSYIIRYQPSSATVLDVFFSYPDKQTSMLTAKGASISGKYSSLMTNCRGDDETHKNNRKNFNGGVVGWYGDAKALPLGEKLDDPVITIYNKEKLRVEIEYIKHNEKDSLVLIVNGKTSHAKSAIQILTQNADLNKNQRIIPISSGDTGVNKYEIILDDITTVSSYGGLHFKNLSSDILNTSFIPGENIEIEAVAYNNSALTNIAYSGKAETNSLFSKTVLNADSGKYNAEISNFRHLENLEEDISCVNANGAQVQIESAKQVSNLSWNGFITAIESNPVDNPVSIYKWNAPKAETIATTSNCFYPICPAYAFSYDGQNNSIRNIRVIHDGDAGLFGTVATNTVSKIENLELTDFYVLANGTGNAGALAGTLTGTTITNVLARNSGTGSTTNPSVNVQESSGAAGGLIGVMNGGSVKYSAAALIVSGRGKTGGLIGEMTGTADISCCYSGGHTKGGKYDANSGYDITGATVGGLVGDAGSATTISNSYSTCSVSGTTAGGFVGNASGTIEGCYCTGLINPGGTNIGAFSGTVFSGSGNTYYSIINEIKDKDGNFTSKYLLGVPTDGEDDPSPVGPFDISTAEFVKIAQNSQTASPYDDMLTTYYHGTYFLKGIADYDSSVKTNNYFVKDHYGDWPAPEIFIINT